MSNNNKNAPHGTTSAGLAIIVFPLIGIFLLIVFTLFNLKQAQPKMTFESSDIHEASDAGACNNRPDSGL